MQAIAAAGELADSLVEGEKDFDEIVSSVMDVQAEAFDKLANALLNRMVHK